MSKFTFVIALIFVSATSHSFASPQDLIYGYECLESKCVRIELSEENFQKAISLPVCRIFCGDAIGTLWPKPTGPTHVEPFVLHIDYNSIDFQYPNNVKHEKLWEATEQRFRQLLKSKIPDEDILNKGGYKVAVQLHVNESPSNMEEKPKLTIDADESYNLTITSNNNKEVLATISAMTFFGARHGLETLSQLIVYDDIRRELQMAAKVTINDRPVYTWRGILLDTSRNFFSIKSIKRTLDGMAMVKLNTLHWHITDSHSFPLEVKSQPELYKLGSYSPRKVYTHENILDVVEYGRIRGIRVMPEFDAPAHVAEGWQNKNMTACFNAQPWKSYCVEPPCGQLDPTVDELYSVLEDIYREMFELFKPDAFHMGGDEVSVGCWNSSANIRNWMTSTQKWGLTESDFLRLWGYFQTEALKRVDRVSKSQSPTPIILWTSRLTDVPFLETYLDKNRYIIQIWHAGTDSKIKEILKRGYRVIISNYDGLYLDCGGAAWVDSGNNWCSPYIGWQRIYENSLKKIAGDYDSLVLGGEATIWSEQIDEFTLDARLWPRASAFAERLWSNPSQSWRNAESRMLIHREQLVENGIGAEPLQPQWCLQHENDCPINAYNKKF